MRTDRLRARAVVAPLLGLLVLSACAKGAEEVATSPGTAADVAVRGSDLPGGLKRCAYSGPMETYIEKVHAVSPEASASIARTWRELQQAGATEGYYSVYADTLRACRYFLTGAPEGHTPGWVRLVATVVAKLTDPAAAARAYQFDVFGQSKLASSGTENAETGDPTGLGPNSVEAVDEDARPKVGQAVWQAGPFNVFLRAQNLTKAQFDALSGALDRRAR